MGSTVVIIPPATEPRTVATFSDVRDASRWAHEKLADLNGSSIILVIHNNEIVYSGRGND